MSYPISPFQFPCQTSVPPPQAAEAPPCQEVDPLIQLLSRLSIDAAPPPLEGARFCQIEQSAASSGLSERGRAVLATMTAPEEKLDVPSTIGELYERAQRTHLDGDLPGKETVQAIIRLLFSNGATSSVTELVNLIANPQEQAAPLFRSRRSFEPGDIQKTIDCLIRSYCSCMPLTAIAGDPKSQMPMQLPPIASQKISARVIDTSLDPKEPFDYHKLIMSLEMITVEHHLLTRMAQLLRTHMAGISLRKQLLDLGSSCASLPGISARTCIPIPEYPDDIPWPILYLRCRLAHTTKMLLQTDADADRFRTLIRTIIKSKKKFPDHAAILDQMFLEAQYLECYSKSLGKWGNLSQTLKYFMSEKAQAGSFVEWPLALEYIIKSAEPWLQQAGSFARRIASLEGQQISLEDFKSLADRWDGLVRDLSAIFDAAVQIYNGRKNQITTKAIYSPAYEKIDRHLSEDLESKKRTSRVRGISRIGEFKVPNNPPFFELKELIFLKPDTLFTTNLSSTPPDLAFLVSTQEKQQAEQPVPLAVDRTDFLPPTHKPPSVPPKHKKRDRCPQREAPASEPLVVEKPTQTSAQPVAKPTPSAPISIGEGPGPYKYAWSVRKWTLSDPFASEPSYRDLPISEEVRKNMRFEHNFAHVIHKVCLLFGAPFKKRSDGKSSEFTIYALPGEVYWDNRSYKKMIFEIIYNTKTKMIFHAGAKEKSPLQVIQRYQEQGCFYEEIVEDDMVCKDRSDTDRLLPDDGSRVTDFSFGGEDSGSAPFIEVRDEKFKATCRLYPFPVEG